MPNVYSCDMGFVLSMLENCPTVAVVVGWSKKDGELLNKYIEDLGALEKKNIPVFVADLDSCPNLSKELNLQSGDTRVYSNGKMEFKAARKPDGSPLSVTSLENVIANMKRSP